jgi:prepilin-type N-terminal cleavage/methylation domain-containing protein
MITSMEKKKSNRPIEDEKHRGYTMIEIMLAVGLIAIVATMAIPNLQRARQNALETGAIEGLKQISEAEEMYFEEFGYYTAGHDQFHDLRKVDAIDSKGWGRLAGRRGWFIKGYSIEMINIGEYPQNYSVIAWPIEQALQLKTFVVLGDGIIRDTEQYEPINIY